MSTVLITGANRGLGLEFAKQYAADGWNVIATARDPKKSEVLDELAKNGLVTVQELDVTSEDSLDELVDELDGKPVDLLILNSAICPRGGDALGEIDYESWRDAFETNVPGAMRMAEALIDNVAGSERKQIAAISTGLGSLRAAPSTIEYGALYQYRSTKTALNMAMTVLAKQVQARGVSVMMFDPGWVKTDMGGPNAQLTPEESIGGMRKVLAGNPKDLSGKFLGYDGQMRPW